LEKHDADMILNAPVTLTSTSSVHFQRCCPVFRQMIYCLVFLACTEYVRFAN